MKKQREKGKEFSLAVLKLVGGIFGLIIFLSILRYLLLGIIEAITIYGASSTIAMAQGPIFLTGISFVGVICCIGFIYDFFSHPIKMKRCKKKIWTDWKNTSKNYENYKEKSTKRLRYLSSISSRMEFYSWNDTWHPNAHDNLYRWARIYVCLSRKRSLSCI